MRWGAGGGLSLLCGRTALISGSGRKKKNSMAVGGRWFFARGTFRTVAGRCWRYVPDALAFAHWFEGGIGRWMSSFLAGLLFPGHRRWEGGRGEVLVADVRGGGGGCLVVLYTAMGRAQGLRETEGGRGRGSGCSRRWSRILWRMLVRAGRRFTSA